MELFERAIEELISIGLNETDIQNMFNVVMVSKFYCRSGDPQRAYCNKTIGNNNTGEIVGKISTCSIPVAGCSCSFCQKN